MWSDIAPWLFAMCLLGALFWFLYGRTHAYLHVETADLKKSIIKIPLGAVVKVLTRDGSRGLLYNEPCANSQVQVIYLARAAPVVVHDVHAVNAVLKKSQE